MSDVTSVAKFFSLLNSWIYTTSALDSAHYQVTRAKPDCIKLVVLDDFCTDSIVEDILKCAIRESISYALSESYIQDLSKSLYITRMLYIDKYPDPVLIQDQLQSNQFSQKSITFEFNVPMTDFITYLHAYKHCL